MQDLGWVPLTIPPVLCGLMSCQTVGGGSLSFELLEHCVSESGLAGMLRKTLVSGSVGSLQDLSCLNYCYKDF